MIVLDETVETGNVLVGWRLLRSDSLELLPKQIEDDARPVEEKGRDSFGDLQVPDARFSDSDLGWLLSISPLEAVCRRLEAAVEAHREELGILI